MEDWTLVHGSYEDPGFYVVSNARLNDWGNRYAEESKTAHSLAEAVAICFEYIQRHDVYSDWSGGLVVSDDTVYRVSMNGKVWKKI